MIGAADSSHIRQKLDEYGLKEKYQILSGRKDISELLAAMDVFVFPSIFEGFPVSVIEAQAAGLRCIVSNQCPAEVIRTEICIPMPLEAPETWAEAALNPDLKRDHAEDLYKYDMNREIRRLEKLYLGRLD
jgi:glycosyltransferase involved in cell wall biosynthesis